jgi:menaquinone-dependent protoporphyrinogen IX oxidase
MEASLRWNAKILPTKRDPSKYDLVVIGTPIWAFTLSSPVRSYLSQNRSRFKKVAFYCTLGGSGDERAFKEMETASGKKPIAVLPLKEISKQNIKESVKRIG